MSGEGLLLIHTTHIFHAETPKSSPWHLQLKGSQVESAYKAFTDHRKPQKVRAEGTAAMQPRLPAPCFVCFGACLQMPEFVVFYRETKSLHPLAIF